MTRVSIYWREDRGSWFLIWTDPATGKRHRKSAATNIRREAERAAARHAQTLLRNGGIESGSWEEFRERFEDEHLPSLKPATRANYMFALSKFERLMGAPKSMETITGSLLSKYQAKLRAAKLRPASIATNLRCLVSALSWAKRVELIARVPPVSMPGGIRSRGRALTLLEFTRLLIQIRRHEPSPEHLLGLAKAMWLSGLRLSEAIALSHDSGAIRLLIDRERPVIEFADQKSGKAESLPLTPDFVRFLRRSDNRSGPVFPVGLDATTVGKRISSYGKLAGIRVSDTKHASAHDLRRTFGHRWALRVHPLVLKRLMRHSAIETTLRFYVSIDDAQVADQILAAWSTTRAAKPESPPPSTSKTHRKTHSRQRRGSK